VKLKIAFGALLAAFSLAACAPGVPPGTALVVNGHAYKVRLYAALLGNAKRELLGSGVPVIGDPAYAAARTRAEQAGALSVLARDAIVEQLAARRHVTVTQAEIEARLAQLEQLAGGNGALGRYIAARGLSPTDYRTFVRVQLLEERLSAGYSSTFPQVLASAVRNASIQAYVGPCADRHDYPACAG